jgi:SAM-dependent methyltransferase
MNEPSAVYVLCDDLDNIPKLNRLNYEYETELLTQILPNSATVLQIGSMDGMRVIRLLTIRPDLKITGLEIEKPLVELARKNIAAAKLSATFELGDITSPPNLPTFDYAVCLNNTLGYIPDEKLALAGMKKLGRHAIVSVFGEKFTPILAKEYFDSLKLKLQNVSDGYFGLQNFTKVKRYTKGSVANWNSQIHATPLGYFCNLQ